MPDLIGATAGMSIAPYPSDRLPFRFDVSVMPHRQGGHYHDRSKTPETNQAMGLRWPVERTNSWLSNFGQLRRNTDRKTVHRLAQFVLAVVFVLTAKLIDWRNRWCASSSSGAVWKETTP